MKKTNTNPILWLGITILIIPTLAHAQKPRKPKKPQEDPFAYTIERNEPDTRKNLHFMFTPFYFDLYVPNINLGYGLSADYIYNNRFMVYTHYDKSYFDLTRHTSIANNDVGEAAGGYQNFSNLEFGGEYYFFSKVVNTKENMVYKTITYGRPTGGFSFYRVIPAKMQKMFGVRAGYQTYTSVVGGETVDFSGYAINDPTKTPFDLAGYGGTEYSSIMHVQVLSVGLSLTKIHDLEMTYKNYGPSINLSRTDFYVDMLYATSINYGDVNWNISNGNTPNVEELIVNQNSPKNNIGFRIGGTINTLNTAGFGCNVETGIRPGTDSKNGFYFLAKFNFALNFRVAK